MLRRPDRAKAYAHLLAHPTGSFRDWADGLGWSLARVHRFVESLERVGLIRSTRTAYGTTIYAGSGPASSAGADAERNRNGTGTEPERNRNATGTEPERLGSTRISRLLGPRAFTSEKEQEQQFAAANAADVDYARVCLDVMNSLLKDLFGDGYQCIREDNRSSIAAAKDLRDAGVDVAFAVDTIRRGCVLFHPEKHGRGQYPRSLKYFLKGILRDWNRRAQAELPLLGTVQGDAPRVIAQESRPRQEERGGPPTSMADGLAQLRAAFAAAGGDTSHRS